MTISQHQPQHLASATPYLILNDAAAAIEYYKQTFDAVEMYRLNGPNGVIWHAQIQIGSSILMLSDEAPAWDNFCPLHYGGSPIRIYLFVEDVDAAYAKALSTGAKPVREPETHFYGDRAGTVEDPFGYVWILATHVEDVTPEETQRRAEEMMKQLANAQKQ